MRQMESWSGLGNAQHRVSTIRVNTETMCMGHVGRRDILALSYPTSSLCFAGPKRQWEWGLSHRILWARIISYKIEVLIEYHARVAARSVAYDTRVCFSETAHGVF